MSNNQFLKFNMHLPQGSLIQGDKYKIIEKIGQGGFGIVYKAFHKSLQCNVCVKEFFFSDLCERAKKSSKITIISSSAEKIQLVDSLRRKFIKEAQRLAQFQNPHIIHVMDNFEENNTAYFAMEYIEGGSLEDIIVRNGAMSEDKAKHIMLPIIDALEVVHNKGLLHLDIKPANILLRNNISAVLIDFGISKYMEMAGGHTTTAPMGLSKGYAPMEQYGGTITDFSKATDVYSICATLYKMVTGITPLEPLQIHTNGLKSPRELNSQLSLKFSNIITKGLSFNATDRPQSMSELRNQFSETISDPPHFEPKKTISSWFLVFLIGIVIIIGSYFYDSISFKQRPLKTPPAPNTTVVQDDTITSDTNIVYELIEQMPQYPGGESGLLSYIGKNLKYPEIAQKKGIQGKVIIRFVVTDLGTVDEVEIIKSLSPSCDKEAIRVVRSLPNWIPGKKNGENVNVYYTLPITFRLD